jgi:S-adenosylmethionine-diacylglycerol 3-amino-3-carboxypropyl transferase
MGRNLGNSVYNFFCKNLFKFIHNQKLIYNQCWEDPRLDRVALNLTSEDNVVMITSAGCNALDYVLDHPNHIYAIDLNPRQNALLELKKAAIRNLDYERFFSMFGRGVLANPRKTYYLELRPALPEYARKYWDYHISYFSQGGWRPSFYFHGATGVFARIIKVYIDRVAKLRDTLNDVFASECPQRSKDLYLNKVRKALWTRPLKWFLNRNETLSFLGVPMEQRRQIESTFQGGVTQFIQNCVDTVFGTLPLQDNYFWRVYLTGSYTKDCCPEYLKEENFNQLRDGLIDRISTHTCSFTDFLNSTGVKVSRFVLLDHMDWLGSHDPKALQEEWQAIVSRAAPNARIIWRSGGMHVNYVDPINVQINNGSYRQVGELLNYNTALAQELHSKDRVQTYGSFYIADLASI